MKITTKTKRVIFVYLNKDQYGYVEDWNWNSVQPNNPNLIFTKSIENACNININTGIISILNAIQIPYTIDEWEYDEVLSIENKKLIKQQEIKF
jgi:hypothetical protein